MVVVTVAVVVESLRFVVMMIIKMEVVATSGS